MNLLYGCGLKTFFEKNCLDTLVFSLYTIFLKKSMLFQKIMRFAGDSA